jgi:hypothetical protein
MQKNFIPSLFKTLKRTWGRTVGAGRQKREPAPSREGAVLCFDKAWQTPAITELHAYQQLKKPLACHSSPCAYMAFPWATLFDLILWRRPEAPEFKRLAEETAALRTPGERLVTVCQHIGLLDHQDFLAGLGITEVFWSHASTHTRNFPAYPDVQIRPFPLYPVNLPTPNTAEKLHLFSFVGALSEPWYPTNTRKLLVDLLGSHPRGKLIGRERWHYHDAVHNAQISRCAPETDSEVLDSRAYEYREVLSRSIFSLCPGGTGPNTLRLWESIGAGAIPVVLSDTYLPPGPAELWAEAAIFCPETEQTISRLGRELERMASDSELLRTKRRAMARLWNIYGPGNFVHDVLAIFGLARCSPGSLAGDSLPRC